MTTGEVVKKLNTATLANLGVLDMESDNAPVSRAEVLEVMHLAESCAFADPHFTVVSAEYVFSVYFRADGRINATGMGPRRK